MKYIQTDGYRAPEAELQNCLAQAGLQSDTECTSAVDLWSLGVILLEMFPGVKLKHTVRSQEWKVTGTRALHGFPSPGVRIPSLRFSVRTLPHARHRLLQGWVLPRLSAPPCSWAGAWPVVRAVMRAFSPRSKSDAFRLGVE